MCRDLYNRRRPLRTKTLFNHTHDPCRGTLAAGRILQFGRIKGKQHGPASLSSPSHCPFRIRYEQQHPLLLNIQLVLSRLPGIYRENSEIGIIIPDPLFIKRKIPVFGRYLMFYIDELVTGRSEPACLRIHLRF